MGAERPFHGQSVDDFRPGPALRGTQNDHRPNGPMSPRSCACRGLNLRDLIEGKVQRDRHALVDFHRVFAIKATLDDDGVVAVAREEGEQLLGRDSGQYRPAPRSCIR